jgi:2-keto-4-pentenoate hydratase/2-oxohepta-3-ene-1,7-dioic acid hydratase in catechol pathway
MKSFERGETVVLDITLRDHQTQELIDPGTYVKCTITGPTGAVVVNAQAMSKWSTGRYHYDYTSAVDAVLGVYQVLFDISDLGRVTKKREVFEIRQ